MAVIPPVIEGWLILRLMFSTVAQSIFLPYLSLRYFMSGTPLETLTMNLRGRVLPGLLHFMCRESRRDWQESNFIMPISGKETIISGWRSVPVDWEKTVSS